MWAFCSGAGVGRRTGPRLDLGLPEWTFRRLVGVADDALSDELSAIHDTGKWARARDGAFVLALKIGTVEADACVRRDGRDNCNNPTAKCFGQGEGDTVEVRMAVGRFMCSFFTIEHGNGCTNG